MTNVITETIERAVARVEVSDEYRVEVKQRKRLMDYSPDEADLLSNMLRVAANEARAMMRLHDAEAAARTVAGVLGSDLVPAGMSGRLGTENGADERTEAHIARLQAQNALNGQPTRWRPGTYLELSSWPTSGCRCRAYIGHRTRVVAHDCAIHSTATAEAEGN